MLKPKLKGKYLTALYTQEQTCYLPCVSHSVGLHLAAL